MTLAGRLGRGFRRRLFRWYRRALLARDIRQRYPLVVFDIQAVGLREHFDPVIEWLLRHHRCRLVVAIADSEFASYCPPRDLGPLAGRLMLVSESDWYALEWVPAVTVSFHPENGSTIARRLVDAPTQRVVMQHGLSDKAVFTDRVKRDPLADFDEVFLIGPVFREGSLKEYCERYAGTCQRLAFRNVGSPKTDKLFDNRINRETVLGGLDLRVDRPTVVYAPTWERWASLEQHGLEIIEALAALDVNVIVKLHHASLSLANHDWILRDGHGGKRWRQILKELEGRFDNLRLAPGQDSAPYLIAADLLVSDASGVAFEFMLLDKPIVFFDVPSLFEIYGRNGIHYWGRAAGDVVSDTHALTQAVVRNLDDPALRGVQRSTLIPRISYSKGKATETAGSIIRDLCFQPRAVGRAS